MLVFVVSNTSEITKLNKVIVLNKVLRILTVALGGTVAVTASTDSALAVTNSQQNSVAESNSKASFIKTDPGLGQSTDLLAYEIPSDLLYTDTHQWIRVDGNRVTIGITDYHQGEMLDMVYAELPEEGTTYDYEYATIATVESIKAVAEVYTPVPGTVVSVNSMLEEYPEILNEDPYGEGWLVVIEMSDPSELDRLLNAAEYSEEITY